MDVAIALVEAYLHANGYLTVTEYPVVEAVEGGGFRMITDIDILAVRLPGAGRIISTEQGDAAYQDRLWEPDPKLLPERADETTDFIIAEVKEGKAELNRGARTTETLITAIRRFAFVKPATAERLAQELISKSVASIPEEHVQIRLFAFGSRRSDKAGTRNVILLEDCMAYLIRIWRECAPLTSSVQVKHVVPHLLSILAKAGFLADEQRKPRSGRPEPGEQRRSKARAE